MARGSSGSRRLRNSGALKKRVHTASAQAKKSAGQTKRGESGLLTLSPSVVHGAKGSFVGARWKNLSPEDVDAIIKGPKEGEKGSIKKPTVEKGETGKDLTHPAVRAFEKMFGGLTDQVYKIAAQIHDLKKGEDPFHIDSKEVENTKLQEKYKLFRESRKQLTTQSDSTLRRNECLPTLQESDFYESVTACGVTHSGEGLDSPIKHIIDIKNKQHQDYYHAELSNGKEASLTPDNQQTDSLAKKTIVANEIGKSLNTSLMSSSSAASVGYVFPRTEMHTYGMQVGGLSLQIKASAEEVIKNSTHGASMTDTQILQKSSPMDERTAAMFDLLLGVNRKNTDVVFNEDGKLKLINNGSKSFNNSSDSLYVKDSNLFFATAHMNALHELSVDKIKEIGKNHGLSGELTHQIIVRRQGIIDGHKDGLTIGNINKKLSGEEIAQEVKTQPKVEPKVEPVKPVVTPKPTPPPPPPPPPPPKPEPKPEPKIEPKIEPKPEAKPGSKSPIPDGTSYAIEKSMQLSGTTLNGVAFHKTEAQDYSKVPDDVHEATGASHSAAIIQEDDGRVWLYKGSGGTMRFLFGAKEAGLTMQQSLKQKTHERLGLDIKVTGYQDVDNPAMGGKTRIYLAKRVNGDPTTTDKPVHLMKLDEAINSTDSNTQAALKSYQQFNKVKSAIDLFNQGKGKDIGGTTGGKLVSLEDGTNIFVKKGTNTEKKAHIANEYVANQLYKAMGIDVPNSSLHEDAGNLYLMSEHIEGKTIGNATNNGKDLKKNSVTEQTVTKGYGADVLLANWDAIGQGHDNIVVGNDGKAYRVDAGGSLLYRAMGEKKGSDFLDDPTGKDGELNTLLTKNPQTAAYFKQMTEDQKMKSIEHVINNLDANKISHAVNEVKNHLGESQANSLTKTLTTRLNKLSEWHNENKYGAAIKVLKETQAKENDPTAPRSELMSIDSLSSTALAKAKDTANGGYGIDTNTSKLESQSLRLMIDSKGDYNFDGKITPTALHGLEQNFGHVLKSGHGVQDNIPGVGTAQYSALTYSKGGVSISIGANHAEYKTLVGQLEIKIGSHVANKSEALRSALADIGLDSMTKQPSQEDTRKMNLLKYASTINPKLHGKLMQTVLKKNQEYTGFLKGSQDKIASFSYNELKSMAIDKGFDISDNVVDSLEKINIGGHSSYVIPGRGTKLKKEGVMVNGKQVTAAGLVVGLQASTYSGVDAKDLSKLETALTTGPLGLMERAKRKVKTTTQSASGDMHSGAGDSSFQRLVCSGVTSGELGSACGSGFYQLHTNPEDVMGRTDIYMYTGDSYGKVEMDYSGSQTPNKHSFEELITRSATSGGGYLSGNEVCVRKGIPPDKISMVTCSDNNAAIAAINHFGSKGFTHVNGVPLENFFISMSKIPNIPAGKSIREYVNSSHTVHSSIMSAAHQYKNLPTKDFTGGTIKKVKKATKPKATKDKTLAKMGLE
jgi:hypothetical protein